MLRFYRSYWHRHLQDNKAFQVQADAIGDTYPLSQLLPVKKGIHYSKVRL